MRRFSLILRSALVVMLIASPSFAQKKKKQAKAAAPAKTPVRGSIVEDRAARKLVQAGDSRYDADEAKKAVEMAAQRVAGCGLDANAKMRRKLSSSVAVSASATPTG